MVKRNLRNAEWQSRFTHQKVILFDEDDFASKGTKLQVIKLSSGKTIAPHFHKVRTEAFYVISGSGQITLGEESVPVTAGDYMLCKPNTVHSFSNDASEDLIIAVFRTNDPGDSDMLWVSKPDEEEASKSTELGSSI